MINDETAEDIERFETPDEAFHYLRVVGTQEDAAIDLAEAGLALALVFQPGIHIDRYRQHMRKLAELVREEYHLRRQKEDDSLSLQVEVLRKVIHDAHGYRGDEKTYDDIQNASLIRVIERRMGLPIALGLVYLYAGRAAGFAMEGLNFPGHFLLRIDLAGARLILDPFRGLREMEAHDLRDLIKGVAGRGAELSASYYVPVGNREMLLRLQNNLKKRYVDMEEYAQAIQVVETMEAIAPADVRTLFDKGVLYAKLGQTGQAADALNDYIDRVADVREKQQAKLLLQQILSLT